MFTTIQTLPQAKINGSSTVMSTALSTYLNWKGSHSGECHQKGHEESR